MSAQAYKRRLVRRLGSTMLERITFIAERRASREWYRVFETTGDVDAANVAGRETYSATMDDLRRLMVSHA